MIRFCFVLYIALVISVTLFPIESMGLNSPLFNIEHEVNLIPLKAIIEEISSIGRAYSGDSEFMIELIVKNVGGNILLFLPLGALAPMLWKRLRTFKNILFAGIAVSIVIEWLQLLEILAGNSMRIADIDDVICNGLGTAAGYLVYKLLAGRSDFFKKEI